MRKDRIMILKGMCSKLPCVLINAYQMKTKMKKPHTFRMQLKQTNKNQIIKSHLIGPNRCICFGGSSSSSISGSSSSITGQTGRILI